ncbi:MAG: archaeal heat shock protein Hsp20 [Methanocella sp.]
MFRDEDADEWMPRFSCKRYPFFSRSFFDDFEEQIRRMHELMQRRIEEIAKGAPQNLHRTRVLPDGSKVEEWGPFVYGYSMKIGSDGKREIREFGNIKRQPQLGKATINVRREREPLVDVEVIDGDVKVVAELPGVDKGDIKIQGTRDILTISVEKAERSYYKEIELPSQVDVKKAHSTFKNGVLEVTLPTLHAQPKGEFIKID